MAQNNASKCIIEAHENSFKIVMAYLPFSIANSWSIMKNREELIIRRAQKKYQKVINMEELLKGPLTVSQTVFSNVKDWTNSYY